MSDDQLITDLAGAMVPQPAGTGLVLSSGTLLTWDPGTLTGTVDHEDTILTNPPLLSTLDAFAWLPGDEVTLLTWFPPDGHRRKGFGSPMILGRVFRPGAANSAKTLQALQTSFAQQIGDEIAAARLFASSAAGPDTTSSSSFVSLPGGPDVTATISTTGRCLVHLACSGDSDAGQVDQFVSVGWRMAFDVSGATSVPASADNSVARLFQVLVDTTDAVATSLQDVMRSGTTLLLEGLNPGQHTFSARYASLFAGEDVSFSNRTIVVETF